MDPFCSSPAGLTGISYPVTDEADSISKLSRKDIVMKEITPTLPAGKVWTISSPSSRKGIGALTRIDFLNGSVMYTSTPSYKVINEWLTKEVA
jgi:hypothetical protein